jgi:hypothetical protein
MLIFILTVLYVIAIFLTVNFFLNCAVALRDKKEYTIGYYLLTISILWAVIIAIEHLHNF